ncbi:MAG: NAD(P)H-quinone oxidoreductase [Myxococcales bacterium]|nr:NAD(P)H-quinone oxidoreductase [Myxococcales bacterium]
MKAIVITRPGEPEVLELREVQDPVAQRGEVRVRIHATAVNRADLLQRRGLYPAPPDAPADIPGLEYAGVIDAVGEGVTGLAVGERVLGLAGGGTYAERIVLPARTVVRMPEGLSFEDAAALPEACITAFDAMVDQGGLSAGERVLVHAVGSGVGTAALQIAHALGATVVGTSRTASKLERATALGLDQAVLAREPKFAEAVGEVDLVLDLVGGAYVGESLRCLAPRGRHVLVGLTGGRTTELDLGLLLRNRLRLFGTVLRARPLEEKITAMQRFGKHVLPLVARGLVRPVVEQVLPLARASEAHRLMEADQSFGKLVLSC